MKKFFVTIGLILGLATNVFASGYKNVVISPDAKSIIKSFHSSDLIYYKKGDYRTYALTYNDISVEFEYLPNLNTVEISTNEIKNKIKNANYIQVNSTIFDADGICRSFTKALAPDYPNKVRLKNYGTRLYPNMKIEYGSIILSHVNKKSNKSGHVAVLLYVGKDAIWVIDQNAYIKLKNGGGIVEMHTIRFKQKCNKSDNKCYYDNLNAYNYHLLRINK